MFVAVTANEQRFQPEKRPKRWMRVLGESELVTVATGEDMQLAYVDQSYTGKQPAADA